MGDNKVKNWLAALFISTFFGMFLTLPIEVKYEIKYDFWLKFNFCNFLAIHSQIYLKVNLTLYFNRR
jgi:hypothetical protein